jgi:protoporphyrinogen oxidase|tara:strand:+ start:52 stop:1371 length:1320 start_codon:yes stop_codon:yes gene_type:complete
MINIDIIGGGPAGLASAYFAKMNGIPFQLFESGSKVGGNCKTLEFDGCKYDVGAHRFHNKNRIATDTVKRLLGNDLLSVTAPSKISWHGKMINFPLEPVSFIKSFNRSDIYKIIKENLFKIFLHSANIDNFRDLAYRQYGKTISDIFLISYTEKLWGISSDLLHHNVSGDRLKNLNLLTILKSLINPNSKNTKHLEGQFYYPKKGYGQIFDKIETYISDHINYNSSIEKILHHNGQIKEIELPGSIKHKVNNLFSTLPIDNFINSLDPKPPKEIMNNIHSFTFRNLRLAIITLKTDRFSNNASIYYPEKNVPFTRIYEPKNRSIDMAPKNKTCIIVEVPCSKEDKYYTMKENEFLDQIKSLLISNNIINESIFMKSSSLIMQNAYPLITTKSQKILNDVIHYLNSFNNLSIIGRNAQFKYLHTHHLFEIAHHRINHLLK